MKALYISDLDGTLLNDESNLSDYTKTTLNALVKRGTIFTVSTARTPATIYDVVDGLNLEIPISCMNGSAIYNLKENKFVKTFPFEKPALEKLLNTFEENEFHCFLFTENDNDLTCHHTRINNENSQKFYDERKDRNRKYFKLETNYKSLLEKDIFFIAMLNTLEYVENVYNAIKNIDDITISYYKDHNKNDLYFLEICNKSCNKGHSAEFIKNLANADEIIAFGDNLNDIPLFQVSNKCFAVGNAKQELKNISSGIIETNNNDGVAKKMFELCQTINN